uniref:Uncharacterized protein n=1 Tax=Trichogramma kaykai TaxID=54128 RepID=A0ABD2W779_9HYME
MPPEPRLSLPAVIQYLRAHRGPIATSLYCAEASCGHILAPLAVEVNAVPAWTTVPPEEPEKAEKLDAVVSLLPWRLIPTTPSYSPTSRAILQLREEFHQNLGAIVCR